MAPGEPAMRFVEKELDFLHASARFYDGKAQIASVAYLLNFGALRSGSSSGLAACPGPAPRALWYGR